MFTLFERLLKPAIAPDAPEPPAGLVAFYWHFARQAKPLFAALFVAGFIVAIMDTMIPIFIGRIVTLVTSSAPATLFAEHGHLLIGMALLRVIVPRMRDRSKEMSESRSLLTGRIVDSYTNILTVKLFARAREEDAYVREALEQHTGRFHRSLRLNTLFSFSLSTLNAMLVTGTGGLAVLLWTQGRVEVGTVAMALPLAWQIVSVSGWVAYQVTTIFENVGVVQEGMMTIARPITLIDAPDAPELAVSRGEIAFQNVRFGYGRETVVDEDGRERPFAVIEDLSLTVKPGEKVGLVGRSGAGKST